jgi:hypothetical protein
MKLKFCLLVCVTLCLITSAFALTEIFSPNGKKDVDLTVNSVTKNLKLDTAYSIYSPGACSYRVMSTATKAGSVNVVPAVTYIIRGVNLKSPFLNLTGCTNGKLQRQ